MALRPLHRAAAGSADLRLAVVSPFVDRCHGTERALAEVLDRLVRDYHCEIHLYSERVEDVVLGDPRVPSCGDAGTLIWHRVPCLAGPQLVRFAGWMVSNTLVRWSDRFFRGVSFDLVLSPGINCLNADVIIVHALFHRLRELARAKASEERQEAGVFRRLHRRAYYGLLTALERRAYSDRSVTLAAVSQRTANLLEQYFGRSDVRVISNAVDPGEFCVSARLARRHEARSRRKFGDTDFVLLLIGNDWRVKGLSAILAAIAEVPALPLHLVVAGNDAADGFREMAKRLGILDRCRWEAPRRDAIDLYAAADVYVSPSREDSFGLPVAEAMACGLPVITSICAGVSGQIQSDVNGFVLRDPDDVRALAQLLERLYADESLRQRIGEAAANAAAGWTWDRSAAAVWKMLNDAAAKKKKFAHVGSRTDLGPGSHRIE